MKMNEKREFNRRSFLKKAGGSLLASGVVASLSELLVVAQEKRVLDLVCSTAKSHIIAKPGSYFVETLERQASDRIQINWKGGPEVIPTYDQPAALVEGVIDMGSIVPNYFAGVVPGAHVLELSHYYPSDQAPGTEIYEYMAEIYADKNIRYIGEYAGAPDSGNFYLFTNFKPKGLEDLEGKKIRVSPLNRQFIEALGAEPITMPGGEQYLAMERGVIDGLIWPLWANFNEMGLPEVTDYAIDIPVYRGPVGMFMNLKVWQSLSKDIQNLMLNVQLITQSWWEGYVTATDHRQRLEAKSAGVEFINFSPEENERYKHLSEKVLWEYFKKTLSTDRYNKLRQLLGYE